MNGRAADDHLGRVAPNGVDHGLAHPLRGLRPRCGFDPSMRSSIRPYMPTRLMKTGQIAENPTGFGPCSALIACVNPTTPCLVAE